MMFAGHTNLEGKGLAKLVFLGRHQKRKLTEQPLEGNYG